MSEALDKYLKLDKKLIKLLDGKSKKDKDKLEPLLTQMDEVWSQLTDDEQEALSTCNS